MIVDELLTSKIRLIDAGGKPEIIICSIKTRNMMMQKFENECLTENTSSKPKSLEEVVGMKFFIPKEGAIEDNQYTLVDRNALPVCYQKALFGKLWKES